MTKNLTEVQLSGYGPQTIAGGKKSKRGKMFADSARFRFVKLGDGRTKYPVHYRPLGVKEGEMYSKTVRWADVVINDVPLETTFEYEDVIEYLSSQGDDED